eukprot:scaffold123058_cov72-Phaeocystis_antarctica.AAC.3
MIAVCGAGVEKYARAAIDHVLHHGAFAARVVHHATTHRVAGVDSLLLQADWFGRHTLHLHRVHSAGPYALPLLCRCCPAGLHCIPVPDLVLPLHERTMLW